MRILMAFCCTALVLSGCTAPKERVPDLLSRAVSEGKICYGHQDDPAYGHAWCVTDWETDPLDRSDVRDVTGRYPAVVGFDLGGIELGDSCNLDGVPFGLMRKAALAQVARGGVVTFSWHPRNPLTGGDAWDISSDQVVKSILPGGEKEEEFALWMQRVGDFLESLDGAPLIFRPWHENLGSWFWWGEKLCTPEDYVDLFRLTNDYLTQERGIPNIQWCYSPNGPISAEDYESRYPGGEYVDILGTDIYEYRGEGETLAEAGERFAGQVRGMLATLQALAAEKGKRFCLSETGFEGLPDPLWWTDVLYPAIHGSGICYVLTWRNAHDQPGHFYAPWKDFENAFNFEQFAEKEDIILL